MGIYKLQNATSISCEWVGVKGITADNKESSGSLEYFTVPDDQITMN